MSFALYRMTISHDRMTVVYNRMRIVFDRVQERGNERTRWSYGRHAVECEVVRCSYGCMRLDERLIRVLCERSSRDLRAVFSHERVLLIIKIISKKGQI